MDLHVIGPLASPAERAAVDAVLGPPEVGLGRRAARSADRRARRARRPRDPRPPLPAAAGPPRGPVADRLDQPAGAQLHLQAAGRRAGRGLRRRHVLRPVRDDAAAAGRRPCLRRHRLPAGRRGGAVRGPDAGPRAGRRAGPGRPRDVAAQPVPGAVRSRAGGDVHGRRRDARDVHASRRSMPSASSRGSSADRAAAGPPGASPTLAAAAGRTAPACSAGSASSTRPRSTTTGRHGGYAALARALEIGAEAVIAEVTASKLMGRGGAAFPTGRKWAAVAAQPAQPHYLVCNADESEPGTFKDRVLLEGDPFATVEAMTIAAFATGCEPGLPLHPRRVPRGRGAGRRRDRGGARGRAARRRHPRLGLRLRHRAPARRRRLHLRRGDGAVRVDRGQARRAAQQAAVPGRGRAVRQADRRQQRRDAGQRPAHRARRRRGVRRDRDGGLDRPEALLPVRATSPGRASTRSSSGRRCAT